MRSGGSCHTCAAATAVQTMLSGFAVLEDCADCSGCHPLQVVMLARKERILCDAEFKYSQRERLGGSANRFRTSALTTARPAASVVRMPMSGLRKLRSRPTTILSDLSVILLFIASVTPGRLKERTNDQSISQSSPICRCGGRYLVIHDHYSSSVERSRKRTLALTVLCCYHLEGKIKPLWPFALASCFQQHLIVLLDLGHLGAQYSNAWTKTVSC